MLKHTHEDNPDKKELPKVVEMIRGFLKSVNAETGKAENRFNLLQLEQQLVTRDGDKLVSRLIRFAVKTSNDFSRICACKRRDVNSYTRVRLRSAVVDRVTTQSSWCSCSTTHCLWSNRRADLSYTRLIGR